MTARQLEIVQHALGVDKHGCTPKGFTPYTRNHFCAGEADEPDCRALVELGLMVQHERTQWLPYFNCSVTDVGKKAMHQESPAPPRLTRSERRYRDFLDADSGYSFIEWLRDRAAAAEQA